MTYDYRRAARPIPVDKAALMDLARDLARELPYHLPPKAVSHNPDVLDTPLYDIRGYDSTTWGFELGTLDIRDVRGQQFRIPVTVKSSLKDPRPVRYWFAGGGVLGETPDGEVEIHKVGLKLLLFSGRTPNEYMSRLQHVAKEAYSILIHEVTHLRDRMRVKETQRYHEQADKDPAHDAVYYYNQSHEVRAFMQQTADEVIQYAESMAKQIGVGSWGVQPTGSLMEQALANSITWGRVKDRLTPENTRRFLKGVEHALRDEWPRLEKQYPLEELE